MKTSWMAVTAAFATMSVVTLVGVIFWFRPIAEADRAGGPLLSPGLNLAAYALASILLFDWAARRMSSSYAAAFVIAAAQYILVLDITLRGDRGVATAAASGVLILASWASVAFVYSLVSRRKRHEGSDATRSHTSAVREKGSRG